MKIQDQNLGARRLDAQQDQRAQRARHDPDEKKRFEALLRGEDGAEDPLAMSERPEAMPEDEGVLLEDGEEALPREDMLVQVEPELENASALDAPAEVEGGSAPDPSIEKIVDQMVEAVHVGQDEKARRVVLIDVVVPGMGRLRARLKRTRQGVEVRLRADAPELTKLLRANKSELMESARESGVEMTKVDIAEHKRDRASLG